MSIEREIKKTVNNVRDTIDEAKHKGAAESERQQRDIAGDVMTPGEKAKSLVNEAKHEVIAGVDKAKRDTRNAV